MNGRGPGRPRKDEGIMGDDRIARFEETPGRESRSSEDDERKHDGTILNEAERRRLLRDEFKQEALPQVPKIPGMHVCWLSTTNGQDPIPRRTRLGYVPVRYDEVPGLDATYRMRSGEFDGCVAVNEMVLFKVPLEMYQTIMNEYHHDQPLEAEEMIVNQIRANQEVDHQGRPLVHEEEGMSNLVQRARRPSFV